MAIAIGDPVGPRAGYAGAVAEFREFCRFAGWTACWFAATKELVDAATNELVGSARDVPGGRLRAIQIGEDTVLTLPDLVFTGRRWQDVRTARNRAEREGVRMVTGRLVEFEAALRLQVEQLSAEWVAEKCLPEMGFTLGTVRHALDPEIRTHVAVDGSGVVQGITTWLPVHRDGRVVGWTLDLMRRRPDGFRPVMDFLIAQSALDFQAQGCESISLSVAPLARRTQLVRRTPMDRVLDVLSTLLEPTYGFRSLLAFKAKFRPEFRPVYLMYSSPTELPGIAMAIGRAYLPHLAPRQAAGLIRGLAHRRPAPAG